VAGNCPCYPLQVGGPASEKPATGSEPGLGEASYRFAGYGVRRPAVRGRRTFARLGSGL
jgi:hypothetical protein